MTLRLTRRMMSGRCGRGRLFDVADQRFIVVIGAVEEPQVWVQSGGADNGVEAGKKQVIAEVEQAIDAVGLLALPGLDMEERVIDQNVQAWINFSGADAFQAAQLVDVHRLLHPLPASSSLRKTFCSFT